MVLLDPSAIVDGAGSADRIDTLLADDPCGAVGDVPVGRHGRSVSEVADDLSSDGHSVTDAVTAFGQPLMRVARSGFRMAAPLIATKRRKLG